MRQILVVFLIINALFWGLMSHDVHCNFVAKFSKAKCPPHTIHILIGFICFTLAVLISQEQWTSEIWNNIKLFFNNTVKVIQSGGKLASMAYNAAKNNFDSVDHFTNTIDNLSQGKSIQLKLI